MSKLLNQWIDLFRAGNHGDKGTFTPEDVQQIVDNYRPEFHEAPAVIGHPKDDAPAYGWWSKLRRVGDLLQGQLKDNVDPTFAELVEKGRYSKRSISLYKGPSGYALRHVGFLGAQPPEVKGLADIKFGDEDRQAIEIEFSEERSMTAEQIRETLSAWWEEKFGKKDAPKTFSEDDAKRIAAEAVAAAVAPLETRLKAQETQFSEREKHLATGESQQRADRAINQVKAKGAWVPAFDKLGLPLIFAELATQTATIEFGESKAQKTKLDIFTEFMESLGKIVPGGQIAITSGSAAAPASQGVNPGAFAVDNGSVRLHEAALQFAETNKVEYNVAISEVIRKNPELARLGGASAGSV